MENIGILTEEDLASLTPEQREILEEAWGITQMLEVLPNDITEVLNKYEQLTAGKTADECVVELLKFSKTNPAFYAQLIALVELAIIDVEPSDINYPASPNIMALSDEEYEAAQRVFFESIASMPKENRKEFAEFLKTLSPEQEKAMLDDLKNRK